MLVGHAFQRGWLPISEIAIQRAIELNGAAVEANRRAFLWGRILAHDPTALQKAGHAAAAASEHSPSGDSSAHARETLVPTRMPHMVGGMPSS
ncbi:hypothetical protein AWV80_29440 [Cupriavidus sp. UYMU48A]|nr:hypothetical protein AWV80_29440 [Cupriavidus sp. UYMU48A]